MQNGPKPVFAFLPVRNSGLRFALHADFDVVAGRDDLVADSSRNEWLQSEAAGNFCDMLLSSKCMQVESAAAWLQFVPLRHEVSPTHLAFSEKVANFLRKFKCIQLKALSHPKSMFWFVLLPSHVSLTAAGYEVLQAVHAWLPLVG